MQRTCKQHKTNRFISICAFPLCTENRLCCLKCMVQKHTDHTQYQLLLDELQDDVNIEDLSLPTNWTNILCNFNDQLNEIIGVCRKNTKLINHYESCIEDELKIIDDIFDTFCQEMLEKVNQIRKQVKEICQEKNQQIITKLKQLLDKLRQVLSPKDLLKMVNNYLNFEDQNCNEDYDKENCRNGDNIKNDEYKENYKKFDDEEKTFEEKLQIFFSKQRINEEDYEFLANKFQFLNTNNVNQGDDLKITPHLNLNALNEIREQLMNTLDNSTQFSEIFFPETKLYDYQNLEKMRVYTCVFNEVTNLPGQITQVEEIDNQDFLVVRDNEILEVWDISSHICKYSIKLLCEKSLISSLKLPHGLFFIYYSRQNNSLQILEQKTKRIIKSFPFSKSYISQYKILSQTDNNNTVQGPILVSALFDNGEIKIINFSKGQLIEFKNRPCNFMEIMPEARYYQCTDNGIVQSYQVISCGNDIINIWQPLISKCVRNFKIPVKNGEIIKQLQAFEITSYEKQVSFFADHVVNCPSRFALAILTNKNLKIYNWFKAQCLKEIQVEDSDIFQILPTFIKNDLKNIFLLYNVSDKKPAEYITCDWSSGTIDYWNSGSLSHFTQVKALNKYKVIEIGVYKGPAETNNSESKSKSRIISETRVRLKSLF